jgi:hypothetical protein
VKVKALAANCDSGGCAFCSIRVRSLADAKRCSRSSSDASIWSSRAVTWSPIAPAASAVVRKTPSTVPTRLKIRSTSPPGV